MIEKLINLGLDESTAQLVSDSLPELIKDRFVPVTRINELREEIKGLNTQISERDTQLKTLKDKAGDNEELKNTIKSLQKENADSKTNFEKQILDIKKSSAIDTAIIRAKAKDVDMVKVKLNMDNVTLKEDGSIDGLNDQIETIKKDYAFLFESEGSYTPASGKTTAPTDMKSALAEHYNKN